MALPVQAVDVEVVLATFPPTPGTSTAAPMLTLVAVRSVTWLKPSNLTMSPFAVEPPAARVTAKAGSRHAHTHCI